MRMRISSCGIVSGSGVARGLTDLAGALGCVAVLWGGCAGPPPVSDARRHGAPRSRATPSKTCPSCASCAPVSARLTARTAALGKARRALRAARARASAHRQAARELKAKLKVAERYIEASMDENKPMQCGLHTQLQFTIGFYLAQVYLSYRYTSRAALGRELASRTKAAVACAWKSLYRRFHTTARRRPPRRGRRRPPPRREPQRKLDWSALAAVSGVHVVVVTRGKGSRVRVTLAWRKGRDLAVARCLRSAFRKPGMLAESSYLVVPLDVKLEVAGGDMLCGD